MKKLFLLALIALSLSAGAQSDTIIRKDTVVVPLFEKMDTVAATIIYLGKNNSVKYTQGFVIRKGFLMQKGKEMQWAEQPKIIAVIDEKKKPVQKVLQVL